MRQQQIHLGVIQRTKGQTALGRLGYQRSETYQDSLGKHGDYSAGSPSHLGTVVLLPAGANPDFARLADFKYLAGNAETRRDAQEGRTADCSLPRAIPEGRELLAASWIMAPFVQMGMAIEIDVESPLAFDGIRNPHFHAYIAQRNLDKDGFGKKKS